MNVNELKRELKVTYSRKKGFKNSVLPIQHTETPLKLFWSNYSENIPEETWIKTIILNHIK